MAGDVVHEFIKKIQAFALTEYGIPIKKIVRITIIFKPAIYRFKKTARKKEYNPIISIVLRDEYVKNAPRTERPKKYRKKKEEKILIIVNKNRNGKKKNLKIIILKINISVSTARRIFKRRKYNKRKFI